MAVFTEHIEAIVSLWKDAQTKVNDLTNLLSNATKMHHDLEIKYNELQEQTDSYIHEIDTHKHTIKQLNETIKSMEEDHKEFSKVSHIVRMERDNCRLKDHIRILERRVAFYQNNAAETPPPVTTPTEETPPVTTPTEETPPANIPTEETSPPVTTPTEETPYTEKKIKGVIYYVSKQNQIHIKESDGSVGHQVGTIETLPTGKTKVKWTKKAPKNT